MVYSSPGTNYDDGSGQMVVGKESCPRCRSRGGDTSGDNRIVYDDGHTHCFACGHHTHADVIRQLEKLSRESRQLKFEAPDELKFPNDFMPLGSAIHSKTGQTWLRKYGITEEEIKKHHIGWSMDRQMLIFPVFQDGQLVMWQGRNFNGGPKYLTEGPKSDILNLVGNSKCNDVVVVTEDLVSAIKVGRIYQAAPLYGATMSLGLIQKLSERFEYLGIWLDMDKTREAVEIALRASQYIPTFVMDTLLDPKEYAEHAISQYVENAKSNEAIYRDEETEEEKKELDKAIVSILGPAGSVISQVYKDPHAAKPLNQKLDELIRSSPALDDDPRMGAWETGNEYRKHSSGS